MKLSKPQSLILFLLGLCHSKYEKKYSDKPFKPFMNKIDFISFAKSAGLVTKGIRALYRNLEILEKNKLVSYKGKCLCFTPKGKRHFNKLHTSIDPYIEISHSFKAKNILKFVRPIQSKFEK